MGGGQQSDLSRQASSFGKAAVAYAEHRPDYAVAAVRWALELAPGSRVLDLGAGTGKLTATVAGNAMHWFDMDVAGPEIARVLVPGGILAGLWNIMDDRADWAAGLARVSGSGEAIGPRDTPAGWGVETAAAHLPKTGAAARFDSAAQAEFPHAQRRTADSLVAALATRAGSLAQCRCAPRSCAGSRRRVQATGPGDGDGTTKGGRP